MSAERPPLAAATVVLLRDGAAGVEVFMQRRHGRSGFMAGATVFPGGKVDAADRWPACAGRSAAECASLLSLANADEATAFFVAALRELHEEARVLLFSGPDGALVEADKAEALTAAVDALRDSHRVDADAHHQLLSRAGLRPALDQLTPFARWITPRIEPRRFDTMFFAARVPSDQRPGLDGHEITHALWCRPADALRQHAAGGAIVLPPPTLHTLERLDDLPGPASQTLRALSDSGIGPCIEPYFVADSEQGPLIALPDDPLHPQFAAGLAPAQRLDSRRNRFVLRDGRFTRESTAGAI